MAEKERARRRANKQPEMVNRRQGTYVSHSDPIAALSREQHQAAHLGNTTHFL